MKLKLIILTILSLFLISCVPQENIGVCPQPNMTIEIDQEFIDDYVSPDNYIQPHHTKVNWFYDNMEKQLIISDIRGCVGGQGSSMEPTFFEGNKVCIKDFKGTSVKAGDIIEYRDPESGGSVVHRVKAAYKSTRELRIWTQGDSHHADQMQPISINDITGVVVAVIYE